MRIEDLWCWKQLLYQLSHNHCPLTNLSYYSCATYLFENVIKIKTWWFLFYSHRNASLPTYLRTYILTYLHPYLHTYLRTYLLTHLLTYLPTHLPTYLPTDLPTHFPTNLPTYLPTYFATFLSLPLSLCKQVLTYKVNIELDCDEISSEKDESINEMCAKHGLFIVIFVFS